MYTVKTGYRFSRPGTIKVFPAREGLVTFRMGTGKPLTFFSMYVVQQAILERVWAKNPVFMLPSVEAAEVATALLAKTGRITTYLSLSNFLFFFMDERCSISTSVSWRGIFGLSYTLYVKDSLAIHTSSLLQNSFFQFCGPEVVGNYGCYEDHLLSHHRLFNFFIPDMIFRLFYYWRFTSCEGYWRYLVHKGTNFHWKKRKSDFPHI
jgi:hypothetical protein